MGSRIILVGIFLLMAVSASVGGFFLLMVDPQFLNFSGFLVFYGAVFVFIWSLFFFLFRYLAGNQRFPNVFLRESGKQAMLCALIGITIVLFSQMRSLTWYTLVPLAAVALFAEYILISNRR